MESKAGFFRGLHEKTASWPRKQQKKKKKKRSLRCEPFERQHLQRHKHLCSSRLGWKELFQRSTMIHTTAVPIRPFFGMVN